MTAAVKAGWRKSDTSSSGARLLIWMATKAPAATVPSTA